MAKNKDKKTNGHKNTVEIPAEWVASAAGASTSLVRAVRKGERKADNGAGSRVKVADMLLSEGVNNLLEEVKRVVKI